MSYRRYKVCPLLTTHGHLLTLLTHASLRRVDIADKLGLTDDHTGRLLRELSGEGLVTFDRLAMRAVWWRIADNVSVADRLMSDREVITVI